MNKLPNGTIVVGAPGSIARRESEIRDATLGLLYSVQAFLSKANDLGNHTTSMRINADALAELIEEDNA